MWALTDISTKIPFQLISHRRCLHVNGHIKTGSSLFLSVLCLGIDFLISFCILPSSDVNSTGKEEKRFVLFFSRIFHLSIFGVSVFRGIL